FESWMNLNLLVERVAAGTVAAVGGLGLLLAIVGLAGAVAYSVSERRREIGIRVALGAQSGQLMRMVLRQVLAVAGTGVFAGLALGIAATIFVRSWLYQIGPVELTVLIPVAAAMLAISLLA